MKASELMVEAVEEQEINNRESQGNLDFDAQLRSGMAAPEGIISENNVMSIDITSSGSTGKANAFINLI